MTQKGVVYFRSAELVNESISVLQDIWSRGETGLERTLNEKEEQYYVLIVFRLELSSSNNVIEKLRSHIEGT